MRRAGLLLALGALAAAGCDEGRVGDAWRALDPRIEAPAFSLPALDGSPASLAGLRGRIVVMEFWATWCAPCRFSLPSLEVIAKQYADREVTILLINEGEAPETVKAWLRGRFTAARVLLDRDGAVGTRYRVQSIPQLFIIDAEGRVAYVHAGYGGGLERALSEILDTLLPPRT